MENYQQEDGRIIIPEVLQNFMNGLEKIEVEKIRKNLNREETRNEDFDWSVNVPLAMSISQYGKNYEYSEFCFEAILICLL